MVKLKVAGNKVVALGNSGRKFVELVVDGKVERVFISKTKGLSDGEKLFGSVELAEETITKDAEGNDLPIEKQWKRMVLGNYISLADELHVKKFEKAVEAIDKISVDSLDATKLESLIAL